MSGTDWVTVPSFPNYMVTADGRVKNVRMHNEATQWVDRKGYNRISLVKNGKAGNALVHRLVLEAFKGACPDGFEASHLDNNRTNNNINNLVWESRKDNHRRKIEHGTHFRGSTHPMAKLDESKAKEIQVLLANGAKLTEVAEIYGVAMQTISNIKTRVRWQHV